MDSCRNLLSPNPQAIWFGYVNNETINKITLTYCQLTWIYTLLFVSMASLLLIIYIWKNLSKERRRNLSQLKLISKLKQVSENILADYVTDSANWRVLFYLYGVWGISFGLPTIHLVQLLVSEMYFTQPEPKEPSSSLGLVVLFALLLISSGFYAFQVFLVNSIGSLVEMLLLSTTPVQMNSVSRRERQILMRFNLKRTMIVYSMLIAMPMLIAIVSIIAKVKLDDINEFLQFPGISTEVIWAYFLVSRLPFLFQENNILKLNAKNIKIQNKLIALQKFLDDFGPSNVIRNLKEDSLSSKEMSLLRFNQLQLEVLDERLKLLKEDDSVPIPRNTIGMILFVPKIYLVLQCAAVITEMTLFLGWFGSWSNLIITWSLSVSQFVRIFLVPLFSLMIFHSKILLGEENATKTEEEYDEEESVSEPRESSIVSDLSTHFIEKRND